MNISVDVRLHINEDVCMKVCVGIYKDMCDCLNVMEMCEWRCVHGSLCAHASVRLGCYNGFCSCV